MPATSRRLLPALLFLGVGALLSLVFFGRFAPSAIVVLRLARPACAAALVLLACLACGAGSAAAATRLFAVLARLPGVSEPSNPGVCTLVGVPVYGTLLGILAWSGAPLEAATILVTLVLAVAGGLTLRRLWAPWAPLTPWTPRLSAAGRPSAAGVLLLGIPIAVAWVGAITPVASPDELIYKLAVPHAYQVAGGMIELPLNSQSYFPGGLSLPALGALVISTPIAAKLLFFAVYLLSLRAVFRLAETLEAGTGLWAAAVVAWTPALMLIAGWCWAEWGMIGLLLLSWEHWIRFRERPNARDAALVALALAGALAGKYSAAPWLLVFVFVAAVEARRLPARLRLATAACAALVLVIFGGFFYIRNLVWTGSPVAPFLLPASPQVGHFRTAARQTALKELMGGLDILNTGIIDDSLGVALPLCVLLSPLALWGAGDGRRARGFFALGLAQTIGFVAFAPMSRLLITAVVPLAVLGAGALARAWRSAAPALRGALTAGAALVLTGQLALVGYIFVVSYDFFPYLVGSESEEQYLARTRHFVRPYQFLAKVAPRDARVLLLGENRSFSLDRLALSAGNLDGPRVAAFLSSFRDGAAFDAGLRRLGVQYVVMHRPWYRVLGRGPAEGSDGLAREYMLEVTPETDAMLAGYLGSRAVARYRDPEGYEIYEIPR